MNYSITTSSYFDVAAKKLAKKYPSFKNDLAKFGKSLLESPKQGAELAPGIRKIRMAILLIYDKEDASTAKVNVLKEIIKEEGYPVE